MKRFLLFTGMFVIITYRFQAAAGHLNPWLDYTFSDMAASCDNQTSLNSSDCNDNVEEYKSAIVDFAGLLNLAHPVICILMYSFHLFLAKREARKEAPVENRPMVICLIFYVIIGSVIYAFVTLVSLLKSGDSTWLGFSMVFSIAIIHQIINAIPNVVSSSTFDVRTPPTPKSFN